MNRHQLLSGVLFGGLALAPPVTVHLADAPTANACTNYGGSFCWCGCTSSCEGFGYCDMPPCLPEGQTCTLEFPGCRDCC